MKPMKLGDVAQALGQTLGAHGIALVAVRAGVDADAAYVHVPTLSLHDKLAMVEALRTLANEIEVSTGRPGRANPMRCPHPRLVEIVLSRSLLCPACHAIIDPRSATAAAATIVRMPTRGELWREKRAAVADVPELAAVEWKVVDVRSDSVGTFNVLLERGPADDELEPTQRGPIDGDRFIEEWERV